MCILSLFSCATRGRRILAHQKLAYFCGHVMGLHISITSTCYYTNYESNTGRKFKRKVDSLSKKSFEEWWVRLNLEIQGVTKVRSHHFIPIYTSKTMFKIVSQGVLRREGIDIRKNWTMKNFYIHIFFIFPTFHADLWGWVPFACFFSGRNSLVSRSLGSQTRDHEKNLAPGFSEAWLSRLPEETKALKAASYRKVISEQKIILGNKVLQKMAAFFFQKSTIELFL